MIKPSFEEFKKMAQGANIIPVYGEIPVDMDTPLSLYAKMGEGNYSFLFESLEGGEKWGRYSFMGFDPFLIAGSKGNTFFVQGAQGKKAEEVDDPIEALKGLVSSFVPAKVEGLPRFYGGAVGYLGYDMVRFMERLPDRLSDSAGFHDCLFMFPGLLLVFDNIKQSLQIIYSAHNDGRAGLKELYDKAVSSIQGVIERISKGIDYPKPLHGGAGTVLEPQVSKERFEAMVRRAKEYIKAGDIIQVVLSQRFSGTNHIPPFKIYRVLRRINPSPYLYYLRMDDEVLIGSSPEILVRLTDNKIELRPIAGTRPRGSNRDEDLALERELLKDPKERAEHLMLVDLGRNDVGRVAETGSVKVEDLMVIERYSHVMHIVSGVTGRLRKDKDMFDLLRACFPAGTVSGAPKIRAMEIIEELEHARRGPYAGAVGYFGFSGNMDFAITIRTLCQKGDQLYLQAGAGIVADSDPSKEWEETLNKGRALMRAIDMAEGGR